MAFELHADALITCPDCGRTVPATRYCSACGHPLHGDPSRPRRGFAASPHEPVRALRLFSTLFPHLPHHEIAGFRIALGLGSAAVLALVLAGAYPLALVAAATVVPLLFALYFLAVDVYEGETLKVTAATLAWGAATGAAAGFVLRSIAFTGAGGGGAIPFSIALRDGITAPVIEAGLVALGPLFLLRYRSFDDVLDGAAFGAIAAAMFSGVSVVVRSFDLLSAGLFPGGDAYSWLILLATIGIAYPILFAGAVGSVCASCYLSLRAPVADRSALGPLSRPWVACVSAAVLLSVAGMARVLLAPLSALVVVAFAGAVALVWLRVTIHLGLREESASNDDGPDVRCGECGYLTSRAAFCGHCGVALRALPLAAGTRRNRGLRIGLTIDPGTDPGTDPGGGSGSASGTTPADTRPAPLP